MARTQICPQDRVRAKLANSAPPPPPEGAGDEPALPDDPDTLAARLSEAEGEAERCVDARAGASTTAGRLCTPTPACSGDCILLHACNAG